MEELLPSDLAASSRVTEGMVRWTPDDPYSYAFGNKPEYSGRLERLGRMLDLCQRPHCHIIHLHKHGHII